MSLRVGGWLGVLVLVSGWWLASLGGPQIAREGANDLSDKPATIAHDGSAFKERLRRGLSNAPAAPSPRRNPFLFSEREPAPAVARELPVDLPPPVMEPQSPALTLAGIATSDTPDGPVRTAVVSGTHGIALVKAGDLLPTGLVVVRVGEDHIVLADPAGTETVLRLK
jgi:hypothetical protein